ncbi:hypothetical protein DH2020_025055 [Rehmannia glutinosa]|uniref:RRM domain-containing protein n=1 Tax=Rehmannia glutinosa TaxID=99300 RepID=A0ABR0W0Q0_REHGL
MLKTLKKFGKVEDIFIPKKKDRRGKSFGFVRFLGVLQPQQLESKLNQIWLGSYKLRVNIPRFNRESRVGHTSKVSSPPQPQVILNQAFRDARTFAEVVSEKKVDFIFSSSDCNRKWVEGSFIGMLRNHEDFNSVQCELYKSGVLSTRIIPLGEKLTLLWAENKRNLEEFINEEPIWLKSWFKWVKPWSFEDACLDRQCWIKCYGIPIHAWDHHFFNLISSSIGKFIESDQAISDKLRLDVARIMVSTSSRTPISKSLLVIIDGCEFNIKLLEEESVFPSHLNRQFPSLQPNVFLDTDLTSDDSKGESDQISCIPATEDDDSDHFENLHLPNGHFNENPNAVDIFNPFPKMSDNTIIPFFDPKKNVLDVEIPPGAFGPSNLIGPSIPAPVPSLTLAPNGEAHPPISPLNLNPSPSSMILETSSPLPTHLYKRLIISLPPPSPKNPPPSAAVTDLVHISSEANKLDKPHKPSKRDQNSLRQDWNHFICDLDSENGMSLDKDVEERKRKIKGKKTKNNSQSIQMDNSLNDSNIEKGNIIFHNRSFEWEA